MEQVDLSSTWTELSQLTSKLAETWVGQTLIQRPRYGVFKPDELGVKEWENLLDADVNNLHHNALTAGIAHCICVTEGATTEVALRFY